MTVLETSEPVAISITGTSIDGGAAPDTIETFSYMSSTLTATVITRDGKAMDGVAVSTSDNSQTTDSSGQLTFEVSNGSDVVMDASLAFDEYQRNEGHQFHGRAAGSAYCCWSGYF